MAGTLAPPPKSSELLPPELPWLYLFAPMAVLPLMLEGLFAMPASKIGRELAAMYVPFVAFSVSFHCLYQYALPRVMARIERRLTRLGVHALVITVVSQSIAVLILPLRNWVSGDDIALTQFMVAALIISTMIIAPALLVQQARNVARANEAIAARERQAHLEARLHALQARTSPHFLFNTLNTVASLIPVNPELAERTLERLADIFRYALDGAQARTVSLGREVEVLRDYLAVQQTRFGNRLATQVEVDSAALGVLIPPLLLQPLVENAVVHGLADRQGGVVRVSVRQDEGCVMIEVSDDGPGPGKSPHRGSQTSLVEAAERLRQVCGEGASLELLANPAGGSIVRVRIPKTARESTV